MGSLSCGYGPYDFNNSYHGTGRCLAVALLVKRGFDEADFKAFHPGGVIGSKLLKQVRELMLLRPQNSGCAAYGIDCRYGS